ncbi:hypothetical protein [Vulcanibacillus modesticaldus]|uniref:hypothetical protein n=1 Tax=Vulcanibacillus modesticaldus TaxID=337097 RepID=UPI00159F2BFC|nr:hypothetical protein [Vulcanibacillus modesticaldus]
MKYFNHEIEQKFMTVGFSINIANIILGDILNNSEINKEKIQELTEVYKKFAFGIKELQELSKKIKNVDIDSNFYYLEQYFYLDKLNRIINADKERKLSDQELTKLKEVKELIQSYANYFGRDEYKKWNYSVTSNDWISVIKRIVEN